MSKLYKNKRAAESYVTARALPEETTHRLKETLSKLVPVDKVSCILDLGGGTGRFSWLLQELYECPVITIDPAIEMLLQGNVLEHDDIDFIAANAESIPLKSTSVNFIWMSNVFHHLEEPGVAFGEIIRVLSNGGSLIIRNGTQETDNEILWNKYFPEAIEFDKGRIPHQRDIINRVSSIGLEFIEHRIVYQLFASSWNEYYNKISQRGLSSLIAISDEAFDSGVKILREWTDKQPQDQPVYEPIDYFLFRKQ